MKHPLTVHGTIWQQETGLKASVFC